MLEQELKEIWKNSSRKENITFETSQLLNELNGKLTSIQKTIRNRDIREISASVIGMLIFGYLLYEIPFPITKIACVMAILWFAFVIYKFNKSKKSNATNTISLSLKEQLEKQRLAMLQQVNLLDTATYWYVLPSFIMNIIFIIGLRDPDYYMWTNRIAEKILPLSLPLKLITLIGLALFYAFTIWLNKRVSKKDLKPLLKNIENVQQQLEMEK